MGKYFSLNFDGEPFKLFSNSHIIVLLTILIANLLLVFCFKNYKNRVINKYFRLGLSIFLLLLQVIFTIWEIAVGQWSAGYSLPFHICDLSIILSGFMLMSKNKFLFEITFFWGIGGSIQALLTPDLAYPFPHFIFFFFFIGHGAIITAVLYKIFAEGYKPVFKSIWRVFIFANIYTVVVAGINVITHGNYLFICHKPLEPSLMDYLGPWPWYILSLEVVAVITFLICYSPFAINKLIIKLNKGGSYNFPGNNGLGA